MLEPFFLSFLKIIIQATIAGTPTRTSLILRPNAIENEIELLKPTYSPIITKAKKDISNFKIRKGWPVGCKVTLRSNMMFEFLERLISIALPRTRDFRGLSYKSFDGRGNYNFGVKEQIIFTEINYDKIQAVRGLNITITTTSKSDAEAYELLKSFGFPLKEKPVKNKVEEAA